MKKYHPGTKAPMRDISKVAARHPARIQARRGEKCPDGYVEKYEWPDSDYAEKRRRVFVRKKDK